MREGYKTTEFGEIPVEWKVKKIGDISDVTKLAGFEFTEYMQYIDDGEIIAIRALNLKSGKLNLDDVKRISRETSYNLPRSMLNKGDIVFSYVGTIGEVAIIQEADKYHLAPNVAKMTVNKEIISEYLVQYLTSFNAKKEIKKFLTTTSQPALSMGNIREISILVPTMKEQIKISNILSTVDEQIENTESIIEKIKELKKGLMQRLLTKGINHTEFKESEVGVIPKEWDVIELEKYIEIRSGNSPSSFILSEEGKYPFYKVDDMNYTDKYLDKSKVYFKDSSYKLMSKGMVVFPKRGASIFTNKVAILNQDGYFDTNIMGLLCKNGLYNEYLFYQLKFIGLMKFADTTAVPQINNKHINPLRIALPKIEEQQEIVNILSSIDENISNYENNRDKLIVLKQALMQKLLTGKIRVKA